MKIMDYGKMAATFVNLKTGKAVRVVARNRDLDTVLTREVIKASPHAAAYCRRGFFISPSISAPVTCTFFLLSWYSSSRLTMLSGQILLLGT
jgi:hypothetical protein